MIMTRQLLVIDNFRTHFGWYQKSADVHRYRDQHFTYSMRPQGRTPPYLNRWSNSVQPTEVSLRKKWNSPQAVQMLLNCWHLTVTSLWAERRNFLTKINKFEHYCGVWRPPQLLSGGQGIPHKMRFETVYCNIISLPGFMIINRHSTLSFSCIQVFWSEQKWLTCAFRINRAEFQKRNKWYKQR